MSVSINDMIKRIQANPVKPEIIETLNDERDVIRELQIQQLREGKRKDGKGIGKYRSEAYAKKKNQQNPLPGLGNVDLILTGALKNEIFVDVREDVFVIDSADAKTEELINKYGDPFGMTAESNIELIPALRKTLLKRMKLKLKL